MITKMENELFNIEVDALIYKYETLKKELEAEIARLKALADKNSNANTGESDENSEKY